MSMNIKKIHLLGLLIAALAFILDQWSKISVLKLDMQNMLPIQVLPIFDIVLAWNPGISFSLFSDSGEIGRYLLILLSFGLSIVFIIWMLKSLDIIFIMAMGFIIGGALGNGVDRIIHGQVVDFLYFHYQKFTFPVFNIADCAITLGGVLYVYAILFEKNKKNSEQKA